jgi:hypothetical protein
LSYEESYNNKKGLMTIFGGYIKAVIDDQGIGKAVEYATKSTHIHCDEMMKNFVESETYLTPVEARDRLSKGNPSAGIDGNVELVDNEVISRNGRCVFYDGWMASGLMPDEIEKLCIARFKVYGERVWKAQNPSIDAELRQFKTNPEGLCLEVLKFKE